MDFKPIRLLPEPIHNAKAFLSRNHPVLFPESPKYRRYWTEQARRCIEGYWIEDKKGKVGGYRWLPPTYYFHLNFTRVEVTVEGGERKMDYPFVRDVDLYIFIGSTASEGFSGFEGDEENSCFAPLGKLERGEDLNQLEQAIFDRIEPRLKRKDGTYKKYIDAKEYLYTTFDKKLGEALWDNQALNFMLFGTRRLGKSYDIKTLSISHPFTFGSSKSLKKYLDKETTGKVFVGSSDYKKSNDLISKFKVDYDFLKEVGSYEKGEYRRNGPFWAVTRGDLGSDKKGGMLSLKARSKSGASLVGREHEISHVSFNNNNQAAVGKGLYKGVIEEGGTLPNLIPVFRETDPVFDSEERFGLMYIIGTGGDIINSQDARKMFESPRLYNILPYANVFEKSDGEIGCFIPSYYRNSTFRDKNGNLDVERAFKYEIEERQRILSESAEEHERYCIRFPIVPSEMFLSNFDNPYPVSRISQRLTELTTDNVKKPVAGDIKYDSDNTKAEFYPDLKGKHIPITEYGKDKDVTDKTGCFLMYEPPEKIRIALDAKNPMYVCFYDPVLKDGSGTSLCVAFVMKLFSTEDDKIEMGVVCDWVGREEKKADAHDRVLKMCALYNCKVLYESNINDFETHCINEGKEKYLVEDPSVIYTNNVSNKIKYGFRKPSTKAGSNFCREKGIELMKEVIDERTEEEVENNFKLNKRLLVDDLRPKRLLQEAYYYKKSGNFDYLSAWDLAGVWWSYYNSEHYLNKNKKTNVNKGRVEQYKNFLSNKKNNSLRASKRVGGVNKLLR